MARLRGAYRHGLETLKLEERQGLRIKNTDLYSEASRTMALPSQICASSEREADDQ
jgi:hypothetical protein